MPDLHDADWERSGYDFCGCGMGSAGIDEGASGYLCEDGGDVSEGAGDDPCMMNVIQQCLSILLYLLRVEEMSCVRLSNSESGLDALKIHQAEIIDDY